MGAVVDFIKNLAESLMDIVPDVWTIVVAVVAIGFALWWLFSWIFG